MYLDQFPSQLAAGGDDDSKLLGLFRRRAVPGQLFESRGRAIQVFRADQTAQGTQTMCVGSEPGEILVAPSTDPGWTPLFLTAGGLVMEMGGPNSHGAVVAREYGIPAVVGVPDATTRLRTGQLITVDGAAGTVSAEGAQGGDA